jgi:hypothetical protein
MKIKFEKTPEQIELVKAMGSSNKVQALEAQDAFAAFIAPVIQEVLLQAGTAAAFYEDMSYDEDDSPSIPVDLYYGEPEGTFAVWQQTVAGGLPTQQIGSFQEIKVSTYPLDSAISFDKRYVRKCRLDVVARGLERLSNDVLIKQERNAWYVVLKMLADAQTKGVNHVFRAQTAGTFQVEDINKAITLLKRLNSAYNGTTPVGNEGRGLTDLYVSPEIMEQIRGFAYNPVNSKQGISTNTTGIPLTDSVRERIFNAAGMTDIWGVTLHELLELGVGRKYNVLFDEISGTKDFKKPDGTPSGSTPFAGNDEILIGIDRSRRSFIRTLAVNAETGGSFNLRPDDQFLARSGKVGFYGGLEEGRVALDSKAVAGIIV